MAGSSRSGTRDGAGMGGAGGSSAAGNCLRRLATRNSSCCRCASCMMELTDRSESCRSKGSPRSLRSAAAAAADDLSRLYVGSFIITRPFARIPLAERTGCCVVVLLLVPLGSFVLGQNRGGETDLRLVMQTEPYKLVHSVCFTYVFYHSFGYSQESASPTRKNDRSSFSHNNNKQQWLP
jgi:hypothetical protein